LGSRFLIGRLITYMLVVWFGITFIFVIPRLLPINPVEAMLGRILSQGAYMQEEQVQALRAALSDAFGVEGSWIQQYVGFLYRAVVSQDFGPSLAMYPTPIRDLIAQALPYTFGLLLTSVLLAWLVGNALGLLIGTMPGLRISRLLEGVAIVFYPIPYFILALVLSILFSVVWKIFPLGTTIRGSGWELVSSVVYHSFLPALSIIMVTFGWWMLSMRAVGDADGRGFRHLRPPQGAQPLAPDHALRAAERDAAAGYLSRPAARPHVQRVDRDRDRLLLSGRRLADLHGHRAGRLQPADGHGLDLHRRGGDRHALRRPALPAPRSSHPAQVRPCA